MGTPSNVGRISCYAQLILRPPPVGAIFALMSESTVGGDLVLSARPVTEEAFAPYGRLLHAGDRLRFGGKAPVVVALDMREAGPRRVKHLQRFPEAKRFLLSVGDAAMLLIVCGGSDSPTGPAAAFRIAGGTGVMLNAGVWHAGPVALGDGPVLEAVETSGPVDRLDRATIASVLGAEGLRVMLPDELGAPGPGLDLADDFGVTLAESLRGKLQLGCLAFDGLTVGDAGPELRVESEKLMIDLRRQYAAGGAPADIEALEPVRRLYQALGIDPTKTRPSSEALLRRVLQNKPLYRINGLVDAMNLCSLRTLVPFGVYDRARIAGPVVLRAGAAGEGYEGIGRGRVSVEGRPVLADREGPFGNPTADSMRTSVTHGTERAFVVLYLPRTLDAAGAASFLDATAEAVVRHCGGAEIARRIVA